MDASDQDPRRLLEDIVVAIRLQFPDFGRRTESLLIRADDVKSGTADLVGTLTGEMYTAISDYCILVLEDYHLVEASDAARGVLDLLLDRLPENCHPLLTSRTPVELPALNRLAVRRGAVTLDASHLAFTAEDQTVLTGP